VVGIGNKKMGMCSYAASTTKAEIARQLGVSRAYITMLTQGKRKPSPALQQKIAEVLYTQKVRGSSPLSPI